MKVENPGGTNILFVTYTIISKHPIELVDVETDENANYQVAQVCLNSLINFTILYIFIIKARFYLGLKLDSLFLNFRITVSEMEVLTVKLQ